MKVSIGSKIVEGPYGGGNLFVENLSNYLKKKNIELIYDLSDHDIDIILMTEPRFESPTSSISRLEAKFYKKFVNPNVKIVHRINECDERKNTKKLNRKILKANKIADYTVFVSNWIKNIYENLGKTQNYSSVIMSGSNDLIFNNSNYKKWNGKEKIKIVTHHWGNNWNKGFEIYRAIDEKLSENSFSKMFEFTFIGNLPNGFEFKNTNYIKPLSGKNLANELKKNHIYLTGSINEPSGNHHIEGALCGIPLLYLNSGGTPEYCEGFGISFEKNNFFEKLDELVNTYDKYFIKVKDYPYKSETMCKEYHQLFDNLILNNDEPTSKGFNLFSNSSFRNLVKIYKKIYIQIFFYWNKIVKLY